MCGSEHDWTGILIRLALQFIFEKSSQEILYSAVSLGPRLTAVIRISGAISFHCDDFDDFLGQE